MCPGCAWLRPMKPTRVRCHFAKVVVRRRSELRRASCLVALLSLGCSIQQRRDHHGSTLIASLSNKSYVGRILGPPCGSSDRPTPKASIKYIPWQDHPKSSHRSQSETRGLLPARSSDRELLPGGSFEELAPALLRWRTEPPQHSWAGKNVVEENESFEGSWSALYIHIFSDSHIGL